MSETREYRRRVMRSVKSKDTKPEIALRKMIHGMGYRYRLHRRDLPGVPDLTFASRRKVVFMHGCFWHGHPCAGEPRMPKSNREYWVPKIRRNAERDAEHERDLRELGWDVLVVWECDLKDVSSVRNRVIAFLG